jgi:hypothetical protein
MKNEYTVNKELMRSWARQRNFGSGADMGLFVLWVITAVCGVAGTVKFCISSGKITDLVISLWLVGIAVYKLFFSKYFVWNKRFDQLSKSYGMSKWQRSTEFLDNEVKLSENSSSVSFKYSQIKKLKEKGNLVMLFLDNGLAVRIYKYAFVDGSWEECKKLLVE